MESDARVSRIAQAFGAVGRDGFDSGPVVRAVGHGVGRLTGVWNDAERASQAVGKGTDRAGNRERNRERS